MGAFRTSAEPKRIWPFQSLLMPSKTSQSSGWKLSKESPGLLPMAFGLPLSFRPLRLTSSHLLADLWLHSGQAEEAPALLAWLKRIPVTPLLQRLLQRPALHLRDPIDGPPKRLWSQPTRQATQACSKSLVAEHDSAVILASAGASAPFSSHLKLRPSSCNIQYYIISIIYISI